MAEQYDVTSVGINPAQDRAHRMRVYFIAMSVRIACVASLFFVRGWWILVIGLAVVILPYFAVLVANQAAHGTTGNPETPEPLELTGNPSQESAPEVNEQVLLVVDTPSPADPEEEHGTEGGAS